MKIDRNDVSFSLSLFGLLFILGMIVAFAVKLNEKFPLN